MRKRTVIYLSIFSIFVCIGAIFFINRFILIEKTNDIVKIATFQSKEEKGLATINTVVQTWNISATVNDNVTATLYGDGRLSIVGNGKMKSWMGYNVIPWYNKLEQIKTVQIDTGVENIGRDAFYNCSNLISVTIPNSVTSIESGVFYGCISLTSVTIPNSVTSIGSMAFYKCSLLTSVIIPNKVTTISKWVFGYCDNLVNLDIPNSVQTIEDFAFYKCSSLIEVKIPQSVTMIGNSVFGLCRKLENIQVDDNNINYITQEGILFDQAQTKIICYPAKKEGTSYNIPESVISIEPYAFANCTNLMDVTISEKVIKIEKDAFYQCSNLTVIIIPNSVKDIKELAFSGCENLTKIIIPNSVTSIGESIFSRCGGDLTIYCKNGSYAKQYAVENSIPCIIDDSSPTIDSVTGNPIEWTNQNVNLVINVTDSQSGLKEVTVNGTLIPSSNGICNYEVSVNGTYTIVATDNLGNSGTKTIQVSKIDKTNPTLEVTGNPTNWTNSAILNITASDTQSGLSQITVNGVSLSNVSERMNYTVSTNGSYTFVATDYAGNRTTKTIQVNKLDKTNPTLEVAGNATNWTNANVTLNITAIDSQSGLNRVTVKKDNEGEADLVLNSGKTDYTVSTNGNYTFVAIDQAGNTTTKTIEVNKIDKTNLTMEVTGNPTNWCNTDVMLTMDISNSQSGLSQVTVNGVALENIKEKMTYAVSDNGNYTFTATNHAGSNITKIVEVNKIDKTSPTLEVTGNPENWVNSDVTLTIKATDDQSGINQVTVKKDNEGEIEVPLSNGQGNYTVTSNGNYVFIVTDHAGNTTTKTIEVNKMDKTNLTMEVTGNPTNWCNTDVTLTIDISNSQSGLSQVTVNGVALENISEKMMYTASMNGIYTFVATDYAGNYVTKTIEVSKIDKTNPTLEVTENPENWVNSDVTLTIKATDDQSGINQVTVKKDNEGEIEVPLSNGQGNYTVTSNGNYVFIVTDHAGNTTTKTIEVNKMDKTNLTMEVTGNPTNWCNTDVTLTIDISNSQSGLSQVTVNGVALENIKEKMTYAVSDNGNYTFTATNHAGSNITKIVEVNKIDKANPTLEVTGNPENWVNSDVTLTIKATDDQSGINQVTIKKDGEGEIELPLNSGQANYMVTSNGNYTLVTTDQVGNRTTKTIEVNRMDKTNPTLSVTGNATNWINSDVTLTIGATDNQSGIHKVTVKNDKGEETELLLNNGEIDYVVTANGTYTFTATDHVGNITTKTISVDKIDKTILSMEVTGNPIHWTKDKVTLHIHISSGQSKLSQITVNGVALENIHETMTYVVSDNGTYTFVATDHAGNTATEIVEVNKVDKTSPTLQVIGNPEQWTKDDVTLTIIAKDEQSGLATEPYSFDGGKTWQTSNRKTYIQNTNGIEIQVKDAIGNIARNEKIDMTKIMEPQNISVKTKPNKTNYYVGETLDMKGFVIEEIYHDGIIRERNDGFTYTPTVLTLDTHEITVTYRGKTTTFSVTVTEKNNIGETGKIESSGNNIGGANHKVVNTTNAGNTVVIKSPIIKKDSIAKLSLPKAGINMKRLVILIMSVIVTIFFYLRYKSTKVN